MPAGWGEEERFAAAMESGTPSVGDDGSDGLARELEIAALLRSAGPALAPAPAAKARAKQRLMAAFAEEHGAGHADDTGPIAVTTSVALADRPQGRHAEPTPLRARAGGRHAFPEAPARRTRGRDGPRADRPAPAPDPARAWRPPPGRAAGCGRRRGAGRPGRYGDVRQPGRAARRPDVRGQAGRGVDRLRADLRRAGQGPAPPGAGPAPARRGRGPGDPRPDRAGERRPGGPDRAAARALDDAGVRQQRERGFAPAALRARTRRRAGRRRPAVGHRAVRAAVGHAVDDPVPRTRPTSRSRCSTGCSARRTRCRRRRATRPPDSARRCATASRRRATRRPGRRSCPTPRSRARRRTGRPRAAAPGRPTTRRTTTHRRRTTSSPPRPTTPTTTRPTTGAATARAARAGPAGPAAVTPAGSGGEVSVPVLPLPVKVPSLAPGLPGVKLG